MWEQVGSVSQRLVDVGRRSALGRIAQFILQLELRLRSRQMSVDGSFDFPVRQEHMADALGLTTVYVNRTLDRLRRLEIIQFNRNRMTVGISRPCEISQSSNNPPITAISSCSHERALSQKVALPRPPDSRARNDRDFQNRKRRRLR